MHSYSNNYIQLPSQGLQLRMRVEILCGYSILCPLMFLLYYWRLWTQHCTQPSISCLGKTVFSLLGIKIHHRLTLKSCLIVAVPIPGYFSTWCTLKNVPYQYICDPMMDQWTHTTPPNYSTNGLRNYCFSWSSPCSISPIARYGTMTYIQFFQHLKSNVAGLYHLSLSPWPSLPELAFHGKLEIHSAASLVSRWMNSWG